MLRITADEGHPRAAYNLALYNTRSRLAGDYEFKLMRLAVQAGVPGALEWWEAQDRAIRDTNAAILAENRRRLDEINRQNREAAGQTDRQTVQRAWSQYFDRGRSPMLQVGRSACRIKARVAEPMDYSAAW